MSTRTAMQGSMRQAAVTLLTDFAADFDVKLQVYPGRPRSLYPPTAFVDRISERLVFTGLTFRQRVPRAELLVIHGIFDSKDAAEQKDRFVDGFLDWVTDRYHAAGANTMLGAVETEDDPNYVPDWLPPNQQKSYYATRIVLEGLALD